MGGLFDFSHNGKDDQTMQNVLGFTEATARNILESMGLEVISMTQESEEPVGTVIKQSIREGKKIKKGDTVTITVSAGKNGEDAGSATDYAEVPGLTGKTYDEAKALLTELGLQITKSEDAYSDKEVGQIVSQSPMKGAKLQKGDLVMVTVSKGAEPSPSPETHTITVTAGKGGSVSPRGAVSVADGEDQSFTITPEDGYEIREVKVDGTDIGPVSSYTFSGVTGDHTLYVVFRQKTVEASPSPTPTPTPPEGEVPEIPFP
jgi:beta-lactam-binding protein with PASTA domain